MLVILEAGNIYTSKDGNYMASSISSFSQWGGTESTWHMSDFLAYCISPG
jgi:hypothetical protein